MAEPATTPTTPPAPTAAPAAALRRVWRGLSAPARFAYHRPARAALLLVFLSVAFGAAALWWWFDYHLRAARAEVDRGHNAAATAHLRACRRLRPDHPEALLLAARVARRSGSWEEAESLLDRYWERNGDDDRLAFERVLLRTTRGDVERTAPPLFARIREGGPDARPAREALATGLMYRYRWAEAEKQLAGWLAAEPDDTAALLLRGKLQEQRIQTSEALLSYRRVLELDPEHDEARLRLTTLLLQLHQGEEAVAHLGYLRHSLPDNPEVHVQWVRALALEGRAAEARTALDDCLRAHPDYPAALAERAGFAVGDGDDRAAEEYFARSLRLDPGDVASRHQYALVLARNGKTDEAAREQDRIRRLEADLERINKLVSGPLQDRPHDPAVPHEIGLIALRAGQPVEALRWFRAALAVDPEHLPTHQMLVVYYRATGNPALAAHHRAIAQRAIGRKNP